MKYKEEIKYDYYKTLFSVYFSAAIVISISGITLLLKNNEIFGIIVLIADLITLIGMIMYFKKFKSSKKNLETKLK